MPPEAITWDKVPGWPEEPELRPSNPDAVGLLFPPERYGRVAMVMGIRADESITRYRAVARRERDNYIIPWDQGTAQGNLSKVYPVYDWSTADVWTAPHLKGWDYNTTYDLMEWAGVSHHDQRVAPPFGTEQLRGLWQFKECFPEVWEKLCTRVAGAATAARYAETPLYSFGSRPDKPDDMSWEEYLRYWLEKWPQPERGQIATQVRKHIQWHYSKTTEPIMEVPHPVTGLSWDFLVTVVSRGDFLNRKVPPATSDERVRQARRVQYDAAREAERLKKEGRDASA